MVTLFTPTYNRAELLDRLYESILRQTNKNFEWIIVDDGSTDNTKDKVVAWIGEKRVSINYIYQENAGKASAHNRAVELAKGDVLCCIDSDDYLTDDAVEIIENNLAEIQDEKICGMLLLKQDFDGNVLGDDFPNGIRYASEFELTDRYKLRGEWSQVYKVSVLRENPYPIFEGEKFVTECVLFDKLSFEYKVLLVNESINYCEYQSDGLTKNIYNGLLKNPTGYKVYYKQRIDLAYSLRKRLSYILRYNAFCSMSDDKEYDYHGKYKFIVKTLGIFGILGKIYYKRLGSK